MTLTQIDNLLLSDTILQVLQRFMAEEDWAQTPEGELWYIDLGEEITLPEERFNINPAIKTVSSAQILNEFEAWKQELRDQENARLAEIARVEDIKARWEAIDPRMALHRAGINLPNLALELKRIIQEDDQVRLTLLETKHAEWQAEESAAEYKKLRKKDYEAAGLHFDKFVEMLIEDDVQGIAEYRSSRAAIKLKYPKP